MSRPPVPSARRIAHRDEVRNTPTIGGARLEFHDFVDAQETLATARLDRARHAGTAAGSDAAGRLLELPALLAHVLATYQRRLAAEAFLGTAQTASSLTRHARRLAYTPDPGLAATGHLVIVPKDELRGTVDAGIAVSSVPVGDRKAAVYETLDRVEIDAALTAVTPADARTPVTLSGLAPLWLAGLGHGLQPGDRVAIGALAFTSTVRSAVEHPSRDATEVRLADPFTGSTLDPAAPPEFLARPRDAWRLFAAGADLAAFPPDKVRAALAAHPDAGPSWSLTNDRNLSESTVFLDETVDAELREQLLVELASTGARVVRVSAQTTAAVTIERIDKVTVAVPGTVTSTQSGQTWTTTIASTNQDREVRQTYARSVTALTVTNPGDSKALTRKQITGALLGGWALRAEILADAPSAAVLAPSDPLLLNGDHVATLSPGRLLLFSTTDASVVQIVRVRRAERAAGSVVRTSMRWEPDQPARAAETGDVLPAHVWTRGDLVVHGNVARISHGGTLEEVLGGSDGRTAFQEFALGTPNVTMLPGPLGGEPQLEVRVGGMRWAPVEDFGSSGPESRHYRVLLDHTRTSVIRFGDGRTGAIPPAGDGHITAVYRAGNGEAGNAATGTITRMKRAHPLVDRVRNLAPVVGGSDPAVLDDVRVQATRRIRTFDRAVSAADLADLALTMPGIARAAARWDVIRGAAASGDRQTGTRLVVANAAGGSPDLHAVRAFLDRRRDVRIPLKIEPAIPRRIVVAVEVELDGSVLDELVKDAVRAALHGTGDVAGLFTFASRGLAQPAYLSQVYARLQGLAGAAGVRVTRFGDPGGTGVVDVISAGANGWLSLLPNDLTVLVVSGETP